MKKGFLLGTAVFIMTCSFNNISLKASPKFVAEDILILMGNIPPVIYPPIKINNIELVKNQITPIQHDIQNQVLI